MCGRLEGFVRAEGSRYDFPFKSTNQACRSCSARRHPVEIEARTAWSSFAGLSVVMVAASSSKLTAQDVEDAVETRKREISQIAGYTNELDIYKRRFCLCPSCHRRPLLQRLVARTASTVHRHRDKRPLPEVCEIFGHKHSVTVYEYFALYRKYLQGDAAESGMLLV